MREWVSLMNKYEFGYSDYYLLNDLERPNVEVEYFSLGVWYYISMAFAYVLLAISISMVVAPYAWVYFFNYLFLNNYGI